MQWHPKLTLEVLPDDRWGPCGEDLSYEGDGTDRRPNDLFQIVIRDQAFSDALDNLKFMLKAWELCKLGPNYSGAYTQYDPLHQIFNSKITQFCFMFENRLLEHWSHHE